MRLLLLACAGGILGPCILPVLPFVFARSDPPFVRGPAGAAGHGDH